ncbi:GNAT family N-acetyltransferase [Pontibacter sp. SGAir0037]|uniref:GNAT family N-acetyltransferase n=1 Tax=Pontibacter sp. SGAir0037 TaxID=2571030 RepID=UPI0010CCD0E3|nr:GNAT family protein [Pontibacter sp. SGAir0037]QCR23390.1 N-acetyltransferase [Pontibacter sp. SGAir0037]
MSFLYNILPDTFAERLETAQLLLRPYQEEDASDFFRLIHESSDTLNPAFGGRLNRVKALEDARTQVQQLRTYWDNRKMFDFGVWQKSDEAYIGDIALKNFDHTVPKAEIGLYFNHWPASKASAKESLELMLRLAFETIALNKVYIRCTLTNLFYGELAESCGFLKEGLLRSDYKGVDSDELFDVIYYGMTRKDYEQQRHKELEQDKALV